VDAHQHLVVGGGRDGDLGQPQDVVGCGSVAILGDRQHRVAGLGHRPRVMGMVDVDFVHRFLFACVLTL
jgi:hypothetical protein